MNYIEGIVLMAETNGVHTRYNFGPINALRSTLPNKDETPEKE
jgi:hypothetical protein